MKHYKVVIFSLEDEELHVEEIKIDQSIVMWMIDFYLQRQWNASKCKAVVFPLNIAAEWEMSEYENNRTNSMLGKLKRSDLILN